MSEVVRDEKTELVALDEKEPVLDEETCKRWLFFNQDQKECSRIYSALSKNSKKNQKTKKISYLSIKYLGIKTPRNREKIRRTRC